MMEKGPDLRSALVASVPQAGGEPLVTNGLTLWLSEILVQAVCPLAHGTNVKPQRICLRERKKSYKNILLNTCFMR